MKKSSDPSSVKKVLILSGPTREYIDPVRFVGNASSGRMGRALVDEALRRGWTVELITGPVGAEGLPTPCPGLTVFPVVSAADMLVAAHERFASAQVIFFAAAVADYRPAHRVEQKISKTAEPLRLELIPTPDVAATLCAEKQPGQQTVGFALQTHNGEQFAEKKRRIKHLDAIVLNTPASLGADSGEFTWIDDAGATRWGEISKNDCARRIFKQLNPLSA